MKYCPQCGISITDDSPEKLCAKCQLTVGMKEGVRMSRTALVGALLVAAGLACLVPVAFLGIFVERGGILLTSGNVALIGFSMVSLLLMMGATICGTMAITEIKRLPARFDGLYLAAGTVLVLPLVLMIIAFYFVTPYVPILPDWIAVCLEAYLVFSSARWGWNAIVQGSQPVSKTNDGTDSPTMAPDQNASVNRTSE